MTWARTEAPSTATGRPVEQDGSTQVETRKAGQHFRNQTRAEPSALGPDFSQRRQHRLPKPMPMRRVGISVCGRQYILVSSGCQAVTTRRTARTRLLFEQFSKVSQPARARLETLAPRRLELDLQRVQRHRRQPLPNQVC